MGGQGAQPPRRRTTAQTTNSVSCLRSHTPQAPQLCSSGAHCAFPHLRALYPDTLPSPNISCTSNSNVPATRHLPPAPSHSEVVPLRNLWASTSTSLLAPNFIGLNLQQAGSEPCPLPSYVGPGGAVRLPAAPLGPTREPPSSPSALGTLAQGSSATDRHTQAPAELKERVALLSSQASAALA